ncbi:hypothetical protein EBR56_06990 [bacterium]|nr:hypothetical protein [bacterium]
MSDRKDTWDGTDAWDRLWSGVWLTPLPERLREPVAWGLLLGLIAVAALAAFAPWADARGTAYLQASFARTLAALAATRGLDSAISLAQSSELSFSFGPGGSVGIGQALDPVNDLVEQYGALLLTSTTALGVQRLGLEISRALGWWLMLPAAAALVFAAATLGRRRRAMLGWARRLFWIALFTRLAIPAAACLDELVVTRFLEAGYQEAAAAVANTTEKLETVEAEETNKAWYERFNPIDYVGERAQRLYAAVGAVGESIVNLAIYFTISTIVLPLGTLWLLARLGGAVVRGPE